MALNEFWRELFKLSAADGYLIWRTFWTFSLKWVAASVTGIQMRVILYEKIPPHYSLTFLQSWQAIFPRFCQQFPLFAARWLCLLNEMFQVQMNWCKCESTEQLKLTFNDTLALQMCVRLAVHSFEQRVPFGVNRWRCRLRASRREETAAHNRSFYFPLNFVEIGDEG